MLLNYSSICSSALVAAYERNKKKYLAKIRKLEEETAAMQKQLSLQVEKTWEKTSIIFYLSADTVVVSWQSVVPFY